MTTAAASRGYRRMAAPVLLAAALAGCGVYDAVETSSTEFAAETATGAASAPSRTRHTEIVDAYESFDSFSSFQPDGCRHVVSKLLRGRWSVDGEEVQVGGEDGIRNLKRTTQFEVELESSTADSVTSRDILDGFMEGEFVAGYAGNTSTERADLRGRFRWKGANADVVGSSFWLLNAGTHHAPLADSELADQTSHAEGAMVGTVIDGAENGAIVEGMIAFDFEEFGDSADFTGAFEGMLIADCD